MPAGCEDHSGHSFFTNDTKIITLSPWKRYINQEMPKRRVGMMFIVKRVCLVVLLGIMIAAGVSCNGSAGSLDKSRETGRVFVTQEATYRFDGMADTLKLAGTVTIANGWKFTYEFSSSHAGYGNRTGQMLAEVITPHTAIVSVQNGAVIEAVMDGVWDMVKLQMIKEIEIKPAPIDKVEVYFMKSKPPQVGVSIQLGLPDGCTTFHDAVVTREGKNVNINVTVQRPAGVACPAIYTYFDTSLNLGSDFTPGATYTLNVNDYTTTFVMMQ
jgi:hypothetical protein